MKPKGLHDDKRMFRHYKTELATDSTVSDDTIAEKRMRHMFLPKEAAKTVLQCIRARKGETKECPISRSEFLSPIAIHEQVRTQVGELVLLISSFNPLPQRIDSPGSAS